MRFIRHWQKRESQNSQVKEQSSQIHQIQDHFDLHPKIAELVFMRGYADLDSVEKLLNPKLSSFPDPFLFRDLDSASKRLVEAILKREKIIIYADYDVDGTVSAALFKNFFDEIGVELGVYIPHRIKEGYSLNKKALDQIKAQGYQLVITVDNGITAHQEALYAHKLGLDLIITDHHQVSDQLPQALAVVNPQRKDCAYPFKLVCGAFVAFNLLLAVRQKLKNSGFFKDSIPNLKKYLDLVALATVADVMPIVDINRIIVSFGLEVLKQTVWPGLKALMEVSKIQPNQLEAYHLGFYLGPRINAVGRLEDASKAFLLLTEKSYAKAYPLALELDQANQKRRQVEKQTFDEALIKIKDQENFVALVVADKNWHPGVVGIVASRLMERFYVPVVLLCLQNGTLKGSGRAPREFSLLAALKENQKFLTKFGGHRYAAGLALDPKNLTPFVDRFTQAIDQQILDYQIKPKKYFDLNLDPGEIDHYLLEGLYRLRPFGESYPEPLFKLSRPQISNPKIVGKDHLRFEVKTPSSNLAAIGFGMADKLKLTTQPFDLITKVVENSYQGRRSIDLQFKDLLIGD